MAGKQSIIDTGNFRNGMVPDVIGAKDSMTDIVDGFVDRDGEIRKRGPKQLLETIVDVDYTDSAPSAQVATIADRYPAAGHIASYNVNGFYGVFTLPSFDAAEPPVWHLNRFPGIIPPVGDAVSTGVGIGLEESGGQDYFLGGGYSMTSYGDVIVSAKPVRGLNLDSNEEPFERIGLWGGQGYMINDGPATSSPVMAGTYDYSSGSNVLESTGAVANPEDEVAYGTWIFIQTEANVAYRVISYETFGAGRLRLFLDRPVATNGAGQLLIRQPWVRRLRNFGTSKLKVNQGYCVVEHQERLFIGNLPDRPNTLVWSGVPTDTLPGNNVSGMEIFNEDAYVDIGIGEGGQITGLVSMGEQLVIFKTDSVYVLRGTVLTDGDYAGATVDSISNDNGCLSFQGMKLSRIGAVWANREGLWVYTGSSVKNLADGRVSSAWDFLIRDAANVVVSALGDRIIVQDGTNGDCLVYYIDDGYWVRQSCNIYTNIIEHEQGSAAIPGFPAGNNNFNPEVTLPFSVANQPVQAAIDRILDTDKYYVVDWEYDHYAPQQTDDIVPLPDSVNDYNRPQSPRLRLMTQPLDSNGSFFDARINNLFISGYLEGTTTPLKVSLHGGRGTFLDILEAEQELEYGFDPEESDSSQRIPVPGNRSTPATRVAIEQIDTASDLRIFGVGAIMLSDRTVDNDNAE